MEKKFTKYKVKLMLSLINMMVGYGETSTGIRISYVPYTVFVDTEE